MTPPLFLFADAAAPGDIIALAGPEGHHAADVKRLRVGESVLLTDGAGTLMHGTVAAVRRGEVDVALSGVERFDPPQPRITVVQALAKGGRDEDAIEAMTEVGVDEFVGWQASRSIAKWTDRTQTRWESTVRAAAKQSRRWWWPTVSGPATTPDIADRCFGAALAIVLHEGATTPLTAVELAAPVSPPQDDLVIVVGPEGGISRDELATLAAAGAHAVRLGDTVMRSSTAGVAAACVILAATRWPLSGS